MTADHLLDIKRRASATITNTVTTDLSWITSLTSAIDACSSIHEVEQRLIVELNRLTVTDPTALNKRRAVALALRSIDKIVESLAESM